MRPRLFNSIDRDDTKTFEEDFETSTPSLRQFSLVKLSSLKVQYKTVGSSMILLSYKLVLGLSMIHSMILFIIMKETTIIQLVITQY